MDGAKHNALRWRWHKERQGQSVQNPDAFWGKCFVHKSLIKLVNDLCFFMHRQCLLDLYRFFYTPLCSPSLCVTLRQSSKLKWPPLPSAFQYGLSCRRLALLFSSDYQTSNGDYGECIEYSAPLVFSFRTTYADAPHKMCEASLRWQKEVGWATIDIYLISSRLSRRI